MSQPQYSIEARSFGLVGGVASHNFWVLRDEKGNALAELHGLATDRKTGKAVPIGTDESSHSLRGKQYIHDEKFAKDFGGKFSGVNSDFIEKGQQHQTVARGDKSEILERWKAAAKDGITELNRRDLNYPMLGVKGSAGLDPFYNPRVNDNTVNSNSVYRSFGKLMGVDTPVFNGPLQPGIGNDALDPTFIHKHGFKRPEQFKQGAANGADGERTADASVPVRGNGTQNARLESASNAIDGEKNFQQVLAGVNKLPLGNTAASKEDVAAALLLKGTENGFKIGSNEPISVFMGKNGNPIAVQGDAANPASPTATVNPAQVQPNTAETVATKLTQMTQTQQIALDQQQPGKAMTV